VAASFEPLGSIKARNFLITLVIFKEQTTLLSVSKSYNDSKELYCHTVSQNNLPDVVRTWICGFVPASCDNLFLDDSLPHAL
jgi:hypothetical protein